jgi:hypothetical protein
MAVKYDYDTLMYKLKEFDLMNEAKLLVFINNFHDVSMSKIRRAAIYSTINSIVLNIEESIKLKEVMQRENEMLISKGIYFDAAKVSLS